MEECVGAQNEIGFEQIGLHAVAVVGGAVQMRFEVFFDLAEVTRQGVDAKRRVPEVVDLVAREELDHVLQITQAVVDRRRREQEQGLAFGDLKQLPVA